MKRSPRLRAGANQSARAWAKRSSAPMFCLVTLSALPVACNTGGEVFTAPPRNTDASESRGDAGETSVVTDASSSLSPSSGPPFSGEASTTPGEENTTADAYIELDDVSGVAVGTDHTCALQAGRVYCSGANTAGQIGVASTGPALRASVATLSGAAELVVAGYGYTCARLTSGSVGCFGLNDRGQLGTGDHSSRRDFRVVELPSSVKALSTKFGTVCVVLSAGEDVAEGAVYCWGANENNQCGTGTYEANDDEATPVAPILDVAARDVAVGRGHTCVISDSDELWCWGSNGSHELGLGPDAPGLTTTPSRVSDLLYAQVAAGQNHTCAISTDQQLYCWGDVLEADGYPGPMGHDDGAAHDVPARVGDASDWTYIATDTFHSCGLRGDGELWCWGRNAEGQLGVGSADVVPSRVNVNPDERFTSVAVGRFHTCALRDDGVVLCSGKNDNGELSSGDTERRATLTPIR